MFRFTDTYGSSGTRLLYLYKCFQTPVLALGLSLWRQLWVAEVAALWGYTRRQPGVWGTPGALLEEERLNLVPRKVERSVHVMTVELCGQGPTVGPLYTSPGSKCLLLPTTLGAKTD